jgi:hypothetical protein
VHWGNWDRNGDPLAQKVRKDLPTGERFWTHVEKTPDCWLWRSGITRWGYGKFSINNRSVVAHRYAYTLTRGAIPEGMVIDHKCHNRSCVNPDHLRVASYKQNREHLQGPSANSSTGVLGVCPSGDGFRAAVKHNGAYVLKKTFPSLEEAERAVVDTRNKYFTHNDADRKLP